jgi:hypothetical protein
MVNRWLTPFARIPGPHMKKLILSAVVLAALAETGAQAGPALASRWLETRMSQEACLARAEQALRKSGFSAIEPTRESRYGVNNDYTLAVRCIASNHMIVFMASGSDRAATDQMAGDLFWNFDPRRP